MTKNNNKNKEDENNKSQTETKIKNLLNENKSLKCKNLLLLQENAILKPIKNEYEKYKKSKETKPEKIQYLIETNNFNFFYNNQNNKANKTKSLSKFENLNIISSITLSYNQSPKKVKAKEEIKNMEERK